MPFILFSDNISKLSWIQQKGNNITRITSRVFFKLKQCITGLHLASILFIQPSLSELYNSIL